MRKRVKDQIDRFVIAEITSVEATQKGGTGVGPHEEAGREERYRPLLKPRREIQKYKITHGKNN